MALIDEYKQAIQDVLDGRAKEAPRPSELPWTEDKAATMWAAAAAELIAEANAGGGGGGSGLPDTPGSDGTYALQNTVESGTGTLSWASGGGGGGLLVTLTYPTETEYVCDKTAKEMWDVVQNGGAVVIKHTYNNGMTLNALMQADKTSDGHYGFMTPTGEYFEADSDSEYPTYFLT